MNTYDVLIIGGGLVGASLACALGGQGLRIGLVESQPLEVNQQTDYDDRCLALAYGSRRILEGLGLWPDVAPAATPIHKIHISERGQPGFARLDCREEGVDALGYVVEARILNAVLAAWPAGSAAVDSFCPATLEAVTLHSDAARAVLRRDGAAVTVETRLLVAADGARSAVRRCLGIPALQWDYRQTAVIANVTPERPHQNIAYERFGDTGPLALLPLGHDRCSLVLSVPRDTAAAVLRLDDAAFLADLQARFGDRLGRFRQVGRRQSYPLYLVRTWEHTRHRLAVIGNAAHTLHPVAAQGFNVGLRDVAALADVLVDAGRNGEDPGASEVLQRYTDWRRWDQDGALAFTDGLIRLFGLSLLSPARNLGLFAFDLLPPAKHALARRAMGLEGRLPRLARGLPLTAGAPL
jgi:2-octaprenyl-6-methoxyphenol hydroxylase